MLDARRSTGTYSSTASTSAVRPALEMAVPAFIAHSAYTGSPPNRLLLAVSHQRTSARVRRDPKRPRVAEQRYFSLSLDGGNDEEGGANGRTWDEPTLEETFDAIDDVIMGRKPGEGESRYMAVPRFVERKCTLLVCILLKRKTCDFLTTSTFTYASTVHDAESYTIDMVSYLYCRPPAHHGCLVPVDVDTLL